MKRGGYKYGEGYKITLNRQKRVYTIRRYDKYGKLIAKYKSYPQSKEEFSEDWTEGDIKAFLRYSEDYYVVK